MRRLSWVIQVTLNFYHMFPYKKETERDLTIDLTVEGNVTRKAEIGVIQPSEAGRDEEWILP